MSSVSNCSWSEEFGENAAGMGSYLVDEETTKPLPAEQFESGDMILFVMPSSSALNLSPGGQSALGFTAYPSGKPLTREQAEKYISVPETEYKTFSIDTSAWPYVVTASDAVGTEELVIGFYATDTVTGEPAGEPAGNMTITVSNVIPVAEVKITPTKLSMSVGETHQLAAEVSPSDATDTYITWRSDNEAVATVDASGLVTAVGGGAATITATTGGHSAACDVTVVDEGEPQPPSGEGGGSSGGGCSSGWGALALLAAVPLFARRKK